MDFSLSNLIVGNFPQDAQKSRNFDRGIPISRKLDYIHKIYQRTLKLRYRFAYHVFQFFFVKKNAHRYAHQSYTNFFGWKMKKKITVLSHRAHQNWIMKSSIESPQNWQFYEYNVHILCYAETRFEKWLTKWNGKRLQKKFTAQKWA